MTQFLVCFILVLSSSLAKSIDLNAEVYSDRPNILKMNTQPSNMGEEWEKLKLAQMTFVAFLFEVYRGHDIYFLARDSEHLYDLAILASELGYFEKDKIHLINVSRGNVDSELLKPYLEQEGITESSLSKGHRFILVDTGFEGSLISKIKKLYSAEGRESIKGHLIISLNPNYPSSFSFLRYLKKSIAYTAGLGGFKRLLLFYEEIPRYFDRSNRFETVNGQIEALSNRVDHFWGNDGKLDKAIALKYSKDLKYFFHSKQSIFEVISKKFGLISQLLNSQTQKNKTERVRALNEILKNDRDGLVETFILDYFAIAPNQRSTLTDIYVEDLDIYDRSSKNPTAALLKVMNAKFPEIIEVLNDVDLKLPQVFNHKKWDTLRLLSSFDFDYLLQMKIQDFLFAKDTKEYLDLQVEYINNSSDEILKYFIKNKLSSLLKKSISQILPILVKSSPNYLSQYLFSHFFNNTKNIENYFTEFIKLCELMDPNTAKILTTEAFKLDLSNDLKDKIYQTILDRKIYNFLLINLFLTHSAPTYLKYLPKLISTSDKESTKRLIEVIEQTSFISSEQKSPILEKISRKSNLSCQEIFKN